MLIFDSENFYNGQTKMLILNIANQKNFYVRQDMSIHNAIEEVCKEWAKYHENPYAMPQNELINALHELNELTFKVGIPDTKF